MHNLLYAIQDNIKPSVMADVIDGARGISVCVAAEESQASGQAVPVRQWERFTPYSRRDPMPYMEDYYQTVLDDYAHYLEPQERRAILEDRVS